MTANELRQKYLDFFLSKGHKIIASASLIPENDPTVLFTTAGMHPLVPYLLGQEHPQGRRLTSAQKCIRTGDIEEVGDLTHLTFFEMLGNWSLGDAQAPDGIGEGYFKQEAINWSYEFLTSPEYLNLDKNKLAVSVFAGDDDAPADEESFQYWINLGISPERIARLGKSDNWWGPAGKTGPCGPDTEMFYWIGEGEAPINFQNTHDDKGWVEIWNDVFMAYHKNSNGGFSQLPQKNVDTGMGLERALCIVNAVADIYQTDLFSPLIGKIEELSGKKYNTDPKSFRVIADHIKSAVFIMGDNKGIAPTNTDQGYIVRRLIRRAVRYGRCLDLKQNNWLNLLAEIVIREYGQVYKELKDNQRFIDEQLKMEYEKFIATLERGLKEFAKISGHVDGQQAFNLYQSYGFPLEITEELAQERGFTVDKVGFDKALNQHQELSRTAAAGKFKGGLADHSETTTRLHTATHLLLASLRKILGPHVLQRGSNITPERLRLDFAHHDKLTPEQLSQVEDLVNEVIAQNLPVSCRSMKLAEARALDAMGVFESKYDEEVKVYTVGDEGSPFSREICGGPHVESTGDLGHLKILREEASSSGVRRIKAVIS